MSMRFTSKMVLRRIFHGFQCHVSRKLSEKNVQFPLVYGLPDRPICLLAIFICGGNLTLIVPRAWEIGYTQPCIKCQGKSTTHCLFLKSKNSPLDTSGSHFIHSTARSKPSFLTTSLFTTGCYKNKYTIQFL